MGQLMKPTDPATYDNPRTFPIGPEAFAVFREAWRSLGPWHRVVDRWRFDLGWHVEPEVVRTLLERDHARLH
jgi:hypothetical protein